MLPVPRPRVLFLNRSYWPDAEATGQLLTELCEDLASSFDATVLAGQPNQNPGGVLFRASGWETHQGVSIRRVRHTHFPKSSLPGRVLNLLTYLAAALWAALFVPQPDLIVVETDPPLLCLIGALLRRWHGAKLIIYLQDIYPDIAIALGKVRDGRLAGWIRRLMFGIYCRADQVVVLSRDMRELLITSDVPAERIACIPNWVDTQRVLPEKQSNAFRQTHGLNGHFIVMYSGNMGLCQRLEDTLLAADRLRERSDILFLLVGDGASKRRLEESARQKKLPNVRFLPYQPKDHLSESLSAADIQLVPLDPRVASCLMPSKLYGILASGTPLVAVAPEDCELADITRQAGVGIVVPPHSPDALADAIRWSADNPDDLGVMGCAARRLAEDLFDRRRLTTVFSEMLTEVLRLADRVEPVRPSSLPPVVARSPDRAAFRCPDERKKPSVHNVARSRDRATTGASVHNGVLS